MVIYEIKMREAAYEKAFELLDEAKELNKQKKMVLCELEDAIYDCYEASKDKENEEYEDRDGFDIPGDDEESEMDFRGRNGSRSGMRKGMRSGMRNYDDDMSEDDMKMRAYRGRRGMRMRRNRYGRYSY